MSDLKYFCVGGTEDHHRSAVPYDFVVALNTEVASDLGLGSYVAISRIVDDDSEEKKNPLRVYGVLVKDNDLSPNKILMDQTLRNALGIAFGEDENKLRPDLLISPVKFTWRQRIRDIVTAWLGRRYLFLRVAKLYPPDIEKNVCRVPVDALSLMGTDEGNRIVLVSCVETAPGSSEYEIKNYSVKAFDLNAEMNARRRDDENEQENKGWSARYVKASTLLKVEPDIGRIMLDRHVRETLNLQPGDAIKLRRDFPDLFKRQLMEVGILLAISSVALTGLIPDGIKQEYPVGYIVLSFVVSIIPAVIIIALRLRARVR